MNNSSRPYILASLLLLAGFAILLYLGFKGSSLRVLGVQEVVAIKSLSSNLAPFAANEKFQVYGRLNQIDMPDSPSNNLSQTFTLEDNKNSDFKLLINHTGPLPQNLKPKLEVFILASLNPTGNGLIAHEVVTTCPTKYKAKYQNDHERP